MPELFKFFEVLCKLDLNVDCLYILRAGGATICANFAKTDSLLKISESENNKSKMI